MTEPEHEGGGESGAGLRLAPGFLVVLPLFLLYEIGLAAAGWPGAEGRNGAELFLGTLLRPLG